MAKLRSWYNRIVKVARYSFPDPYPAFSTGVLPLFDLIDVKITPAFCKRIQIWLNVIFKVIDVSTETICQKIENRQSVNFVRTRSVIEKLIQFLKLRCMAREICKNENICMFDFEENPENISNHAFCLINELMEHYFNEIAPKDT